MNDDPMIAALLRERAGYERRGLADRVAAVDVQLALRGYEPPTPAEQTEQPPTPPTEQTPTPAVQTEQPPTPPADDKPRARRAPKKAQT